MKLNMITSSITRYAYIFINIATISRTKHLASAAHGNVSLGYLFTYVFSAHGWEHSSGKQLSPSALVGDTCLNHKDVLAPFKQNYVLSLPWEGGVKLMGLHVG